MQSQTVGPQAGETKRTALVVDAFGPPRDDWQHAWRILTDALGLNGSISAGDHVRLTPAGFAPIEGVVYAAAPNVLSVRTADGLYRFVKAGPFGMVSHRIFSDAADGQQTAQAWQAWVSQLFA